MKLKESRKDIEGGFASKKATQRSIHPKEICNVIVTQMKGRFCR